MNFFNPRRGEGRLTRRHPKPFHIFPRLDDSDVRPGAIAVHGPDYNGQDDEVSAVAGNHNNSTDDGVNSGNQESTKFQTLIRLFLAIVIVSVIIAVIVVVARRTDSVGESQTLQSYTTPTAAPTETIEKCEYMFKIPIAHFTDEIHEKYENIRDTYIPDAIPEFDPTILIADPCGPINLAISWFAYDTVQRGVSTQEYSLQRFLLALLYTSLGGNHWHTTDFFHYLREGDECSKWERVGCDDAGNVDSLDFRGTGGLSLAGTIPTEIGLLTSLSKYFSLFVLLSYISSMMSLLYI